jgi:hypothetical protein
VITTSTNPEDILPIELLKRGSMVIQFQALQFKIYEDKTCPPDELWIASDAGKIIQKFKLEPDGVREIWNSSRPLTPPIP